MHVIDVVLLIISNAITIFYKFSFAYWQKNNQEGFSVMNFASTYDACSLILDYRHFPSNCSSKMNYLLLLFLS
ncbi:hypothetical protein JHK82_049124 [Glycine max]|nr:hypothetical protein JHK82_049124 [Glycine max]